MVESAVLPTRYSCLYVCLARSVQLIDDLQPGDVWAMSKIIRHRYEKDGGSRILQ